MIQKADYILELLTDSSDLSFANEQLQSGAYLMGDPESPTFDVAQVQAVTDTQDGRVAWSIKSGDTAIGIMWISLRDSEDIEAPSLHLVANASEDTAKLLIKDAVRHAYCHLPYATLYSRHLLTQVSTARLDKKLGFEKDGDPYEDEHGQKWQNICLVL